MWRINFHYALIPICVNYTSQNATEQNIATPAPTSTPSTLVTPQRGFSC